MHRFQREAASISGASVSILAIPMADLANQKAHPFGLGQGVRPRATSGPFMADCGPMAEIKAQISVRQHLWECWRRSYFNHVGSFWQSSPT